MASLNKVQLIGNLGKDPEVRYTPSGACVVNVSIATTDRWKDRDSGELQEQTEWHRVVFYGRLAEVVGEYARKGAPLYVEGKLRTRKWADKDGRDVYTTEVVADEMQLLGRSGKPEGAGEESPAKEVAPKAGASGKGATRSKSKAAADADGDPAAY